jgi:hypothetical protein
VPTTFNRRNKVNANSCDNKQTNSYGVTNKRVNNRAGKQGKQLSTNKRKATYVDFSNIQLIKHVNDMNQRTRRIPTSVTTTNGKGDAHDKWVKQRDECNVLKTRETTGAKQL